MLGSTEIAQRLDSAGHGDTSNKICRDASFVYLVAAIRDDAVFPRSEKLFTSTYHHNDCEKSGKNSARLVQVLCTTRKKRQISTLQSFEIGQQKLCVTQLLNTRHASPPNQTRHFSQSLIDANDQCCKIRSFFWNPRQPYGHSRPMNVKLEIPETLSENVSNGKGLPESAGRSSNAPSNHSGRLACTARHAS